jgi:hypothetical protein
LQYTRWDLIGARLYGKDPFVNIIIKKSVASLMKIVDDFMQTEVRVAPAL